MNQIVNKGRFGNRPYISVQTKEIAFCDFLELEPKPQIYYNGNVYIYLHSNLFVIADFFLADQIESYVNIITPTIQIVEDGIYESGLFFEIFGKKEDISHSKNSLVTKKHSQKTYIMFDSSTGMYKIGKSNNPKYRETTLQSEKPTVELVLICDKDIEEKLHRHYSDKRYRGEWFKLNADDILDIIQNHNFVKPGL